MRKVESRRVGVNKKGESLAKPFFWGNASKVKEGERGCHWE